MGGVADTGRVRADGDSAVEDLLVCRWTLDVRVFVPRLLHVKGPELKARVCWVISLTALVFATSRWLMLLLM